MGLIDAAFRLTRKQLVALYACRSGLAEFDRRFRDGVFEAHDVAEIARLTGGVCDEWITWLGPLAFSGSGSGSGSGDGYGSGYGDGYGSGSGSGYGDGYGDGSGSGYGDGYGDG